MAIAVVAAVTAVTASVKPGSASSKPALGFGDTGETVMGTLVASTPNVSLTRNWIVYVPGVAGIEKLTVDDETPVAGGTRVPFRYFQSMRLEPA